MMVVVTTAVEVTETAMATMAVGVYDIKDKNGSNGTYDSNSNYNNNSKSDSNDKLQQQ